MYTKQMTKILTSKIQGLTDFSVLRSVDVAFKNFNGSMPRIPWANEKNPGFGARAKNAMIGLERPESPVDPCHR